MSSDTDTDTCATEINEKTMKEAKQIDTIMRQLPPADAKVILICASVLHARSLIGEEKEPDTIAGCEV